MRRTDEQATVGQHITVQSGAGRRGQWAEQLPFDVGRREPLTLDLQSLDFAEPLFNVRLTASLHRQAASGRDVRVLAPSDPQVVNYMARMGIGTGLPACCNFVLPSVVPHDRRDVLIPVTHLERVEEVEPLAERFADLLAAQLGQDASGVADTLVLSLAELCDNAATHGQSPYGTYVAAQRYQATRTVLAIGDQGIGIPSHLRRKRRSLLDDGPALALATERGVSGTLDPDRGEGYGAILATLRRLRLPQATLRIWSGGGRLNLVLVHGEVSHRAAQTVPEETPGAWVVIDLSTKVVPYASS